MAAPLGELTGVRLRSWAVGAASAFVGWLFAVLLLALGVRPLGWVLLGVAVLALGVTTLYAVLSRAPPLEVFGFAFACIALEWPVLALLTLLILSWANVGRWE